MICNRFKRTVPFHGTPLDSFKDNNGVFLNVRDFERFTDAQFVKNEYGYIRSDISQLMQSQNQLQFAKLAERLQSTISERGLDTSKMCDEEIISLVRPRWCQSPAQKIAFEEYLLSQRIAGLEAWKAKKDAEEAAQKEADEVAVQNTLEHIGNE